MFRNNNPQISTRIEIYNNISITLKILLCWHRIAHTDKCLTIVMCYILDKNTDKV